MKGNVLYEVINNVAVLTVDNPPVNPLSEGVRNGAYEGMVKAEADPDVKAIVITGKGRAFIAATSKTGVNPAKVPVTNASSAPYTCMSEKFFSNTGMPLALHTLMTWRRVIPSRQ